MNRCTHRLRTSNQDRVGITKSQEHDVIILVIIDCGHCLQLGFEFVSSPIRVRMIYISVSVFHWRTVIANVCNIIPAKYMTLCIPWKSQYPYLNTLRA